MTQSVSRRAFLGGALAAGAVAAIGCKPAEGTAGVVRIGYQANLTNAPILAGIMSGRLARALAPLRIECLPFRAGPRVAEALLGRSIDVGVSGPAPIVITQARHGDDTFRVLSGCASGGASFVVGARAAVARSADLAGKIVATPQLGSTQDIALRKYLRAEGLETIERGGSVRVTALASATILQQMKIGALHGAWLPEPWATRAVREIGAVRFLDEREIWPSGRFSSALVSARHDFATARATDTARVLAAIGDEIDRAVRAPATTRDESYAAIKKLVGSAGDKDVYAEAWTRVAFGRDRLSEEVVTFAGDAYALGLVPRVAAESLFA